MMSNALEVDVLDSSSFTSLIQREQSDEIVHIDLHTACLIGDVESLQDFIGLQVDLDKINRGGWTPLMYAANVGRDNVLKLLLEAHADINVPSRSEGQTALMLASYCASESIIYFLLQNGAHINMQDYKGRTSLFHAVKQGHQSAVNLLASYGADVNISEHATGLSPIMEAAISGHENIFNILLTHGASLTQRTKSGETVRHLAQRSGHMNIVQLVDVAMKPPNIPPPQQLPEIQAIDINQGPRAFEQLCMNNNMNPTPNAIPDNNREADVNTQDMRGERCVRWQSSLPPRIHKLFEELNVISYLPLFEKQGIDVDAFLTLTDDDLKAMGVDKLGPRKRVKLVMDRYRQSKSCGSDDVSMKPCSSEMDPSQNEEIERLNVQLQQAMSFIEQHGAYLQQQSQHEQEYRDMAKYMETEQQRMNEIMFYVRDVGKNCNETIAQLHKIKEHQRRMGSLLNDIKTHPNSASMMADLGIDGTLLDASASTCRDVDLCMNRLEMTYKQVERTLGVVQMTSSHGQQQDTNVLQQTPP